MTPGVSTEADVRRELASSPLKRWAGFRYFPEGEYVPVAYFVWRAQGKPANTRYYNRIYMDDGRVSHIEVYPGLHLTLQQVVAELGPPDSVYAAFGPGGDILYFEVVLDYPDLGVSLRGEAYPRSRAELLVGDDVVRIPEDARLLRVDYYAPAPLEQVLAQVYGHSPERVTELMHEIQPWNGFASVKLARLPRW